ncbi:MAG: N-acetyltransferase [Propionibacteriaceae bacterium]|nr:N-acetyltransferase [Propionibacteriaceae bacterium]
MSEFPGTVRPAITADAAACAAVYAPYVRDTAITFETEVPTAADMAGRIAAHGASHAWLVLEREGEVVGYAYAYAFSPRPAYDWSCEISIYLAPDNRGRGDGRALYDTLLPLLGERGYRRALARIALPNPASIAFHHRFGFTESGVLRRVGWKLGAWHDVAYLQRDLGDPTAPPS